MRIRIDNLELRKYTTTKVDKVFYEIIKWGENKHFGKEDEYKKDGFVEIFEGWGIQKDHYTIHKDCFKNPETCYVIAFIEKGSESWELKSVGERLLDLTNEEWLNFHEIYRLGQSKLNKLENICY